MVRLVYEGRDCVGGPVRKSHCGLFLKSLSMDDRDKRLRAALLIKRKKHPCLATYPSQGKTFADLWISDDGVKYLGVFCRFCNKEIVSELNCGK